MYVDKEGFINIYIVYQNMEGIFNTNVIILHSVVATASGPRKESTCSSRSLWGKAC